MPPDFPEPKKREKAAYRTPAATASTPTTEPSGPKTVTRAEPPRDDPPTPPPGVASPKMSQEEIKALLAVHTANAPTKWESAGTRIKVLFLPTGVISIVLSFVLGTWGFFVPIVIAILFAAGPLLRQRREGW